MSTQQLLPPQPTFKQARATTLLNNYDPAAYPPDLDFAQQHALSQRVGKYVPPLEDVLRCRCCLQPIHKEQMPLSCELSQMFHLGASTPLYFEFIKQCLILLLFNFVILALPAFLVNYTQGQECGYVNDGVKGFLNSICRGSVINILNVKIIDGMQIQAGIFFFAVIVNILFIGFMELKMDLLASWYNQGRLKAVDYSLMIKGLPSDVTLSEIQKYLEDKLLLATAPDQTIVKIYIIYNFKNYLNMLHKRQQIAQKNIQLSYNLSKLQEKNLLSSNYERKLALQKQRTHTQQMIKQNNQAMEKLEIEINQFEKTTQIIQKRVARKGALEDKQTKKISNFSGKVIITLNNRHSQQLIINQYQKQPCCQRLSYSLSELIGGNKSKVMISRAPEPEDIIFANMGSKRTTIWKTRLLYTLLIFFLLGIDFLIVALARKLIKQEKAVQQGNIIFSFFNSIIVSLFCSMFRHIIRKSEGDSYYNTYSKLGYQVVSKMVVVFMINMLFTTFAANVASFYLIKEDTPTFDAFPLNFQTFLYDCFFLIATNPIFSTVLVVLDHRHLRGLIKKEMIKRDALPVSQGEANRSFQNMNFDLCYKYGTIYRFLIFTAGIMPLYPLSVLLCGFALSSLYWLDKYLLLRRYSITLKMTARFSTMVQRLMSLFPIYLSATTFLVMFIPVGDGSAFQGSHYTKVYYYLSGSALAVSILNYYVGYGWLKKLFRYALDIHDREEQEEFPEYKHIERDLVSDYSHNYPYFRVTSKIDPEKNEQIRQHKMDEMRQNEQIGSLDLLKHYMSDNRYY